MLQQLECSERFEMTYIEAYDLFLQSETFVLVFPSSSERETGDFFMLCMLT